MERDYIRARGLSCRIKVAGPAIRNDIKYESQARAARHALRVSDGVYDKHCLAKATGSDG